MPGLQTPQRPLPGAFLKTPRYGGPVFNDSRVQSQGLELSSARNLTSDTRSAAMSDNRSIEVSSQSGAMTRQSKEQSEKDARSKTIPEPKPVERAAQTINDCLVRDTHYPELDSYISQGTSCDYDISDPMTWAPFQRLKLYDIPEKIFEQYNRAQLSTSMGLFAELNHAWVAIDNALYIWDYTIPDPPLVGFEEQSKQITAVALVTPRPGVFVPSINRLLVVATTAEIHLLGLSASAASSEGFSIALFSTGMQVPLKGCDVSVIVGSARTGRIFFAGRDSDDVYEVTYQQEEKWFSSRCGKINQTARGLSTFAPVPLISFGSNTTQEHVVQLILDDSRSLLYALSSKSTIRVFHMTASQGLNCVITRPLAATLRDITHMSNAVSDLLSANMSIISISAIGAQEASKMHLMATTSTGCRIYLSATSSYSFYAAASGSQAPPNSMQVQHVKFPPPDSAKLQNSQQLSSQTVSHEHSMNGVNTSRLLNPTRMSERYAPGYFMCFVPRGLQSTTDVAFISAPDSGRIFHAPDPSRPFRFIELGMWLGLEARVEAVGLVSLPFSARSAPQGFANELTTQFDQPASEIAVLTNSGIQTFRRRRLVDIFASMIRNGGGSDGLEVEMKRFARQYGRGEFASTALATACGQSLDVSSDARLIHITEPDILEFARKAFIEYGGKPQLQENPVAEQSAQPIDLVQPSARWEGLSLYVARLVRSVWKTNVLREQQSPTQGFMVISLVPTSKLARISQDLIKLKEFLQSNRNFIDGLSGPEALGLTATKQEEVALQAEHRALHAQMVLMDSIIEGIAFVQVLFDERVEEIVVLLAPEIRKQTCNLTFEQLFSTTQGRELAKELVKAIVNRNIARGSNVETVAEALRRRCGSFCSADDVVVFKAQEQLKRASEAGSDSEFSRNLLNESLRLFTQVAGSINFEQLDWAASNFSKLQFFAGAIQLALTVAKELDRGNKALAWIEDGRPMPDSRSELFDLRRRCYVLIHEVLLTIDQSTPSEDQASAAAFRLRCKEATEVIDMSIDEVFHTDLYDWYLSQDQTDKVLDIRSPYIVSYLERKAKSDARIADLLWRYHTRSGHPHDAAVVQLDLAKSQFPSLSLDDRIQYLGRAKANASMASPGVSRQDRYQLSREIGDLLSIANIQSDILQRLSDDSRVTAERLPLLREELNGPLLPMNVLYNRYADEAAYFDLCILIYQIADYRNPQDIRNTWKNLIDRTHEEAVQRQAEGPQPWESVAEKIRSLGTRLNLTEIIFPVSDILPLLERYAHEMQSGLGPRTWVVDLFLDIGVPAETIFSVLESIFYDDRPPFQGRNRRHIAAEIIHVVISWLQSSMRGSAPSAAKTGLLGGPANASAVTQCLTMLNQSGTLDSQGTEACRDLRIRLDHLLGY